MSDVDLAAVKRRRNVMMIANVAAAVTAIAAIVLYYFKFAQSWALVAFVLALLVGFGAQIWFIAGLRRKGA